LALLRGRRQNSIEPAGKRAIRAPDDQSDRSGSQNREHNQESGY